MEIPRVSLKDFASRRHEIKSQLSEAAKGPGFFVLCDQESPSKEDIEKIFEYSAKYFQLPKELKEKLPFQKFLNCGYEYKSQVRPSTGTTDLKETLQLQYHKKNTYWPAVDDVGEDWVSFIQGFIKKSQKLSMDVLECLAESLGFEKDFFSKAHMIEKDTSQSTLRLLHYPDVTGEHYPGNTWRAGAHTDFDCLTLLFQRSGDHGLEVCPGRSASTEYAIGDKWTHVEAETGEIVINIGDMLMWWSNDRYKSNFHRVRCPQVGENQSERFTVAWFNQANSDIVIQGLGGKTTTGREFIVDAMRKNFARLDETLKN